MHSFLFYPAYSVFKYKSSNIDFSCFQVVNIGWFGWNLLLLSRTAAGKTHRTRATHWVTLIFPVSDILEKKEAKSEPPPVSHILQSRRFRDFPRFGRQFPAFGLYISNKSFKFHLHYLFNQQNFVQNSIYYKSRVIFSVFFVIYEIQTLATVYCVHLNAGKQNSLLNGYRIWNYADSVLRFP